MKSLIENEIYKILMKRKILFILLLIIVFVGLFVYGESYIYEKTLERFQMVSQSDDYSWESLANQQLKNFENR
ncbi:ABC transporter permease, partial [Clostridiaceae bacterium HSG29]|nr:ABC transporter permease [Clostridiaceae bacterium HSG29]